MSMLLFFSRIIWSLAVVFNVWQAVGLLFLGWESTPIIAGINNLLLAGCFLFWIFGARK